MPRVLCLTTHSDRAESASIIGLHKAGFDITVVCSSDGLHYDNFMAGGLNVIELNFKANVDRHAIRVVRKLLQEGAYDILHVYNNRTITNGLLAARGLPVKVIAYRGIVGNVSFLDPISWLRYLNPRVIRIICVADAIRDFFLNMRFLGLKMARNKPITVHKGHDLSWYQEQPADLGQFGIPADAFVVGCVANARPRKGLPILIESARELPANAPIHFLLVGHMDQPDIRRAMERSPYRDNIHLAGFRTDAPALMAACDTFVLPSIKREGLPRAVIEAMAYATAPIVTDSGGSPELVVHGESGLIVRSGSATAIAQAVKQLYEDRALCAAMGAAARIRIRDHFRVEDTVRKTAEVYRDVLT